MGGGSLHEWLTEMEDGGWAGLFTLALDVKWRGCNVWAKVLVKKRSKDARIDVLKNKENDCSS